MVFQINVQKISESIPNIYNEKYETEQGLDVRNKGTQHVANIDELLYKLKVPVREGRGGTQSCGVTKDFNWRQLLPSGFWGLK